MQLNYFQWTPPIEPVFKRLLRKTLNISPEASFSIGNAGDLLNTFLLSKIFPRAVLNPVMGGALPKLFCIGSLAHCVKENDVLFGIGVLNPSKTENIPANIDVHGLRGPLSYDFLKRKKISLRNVKFLMDPGVLAAARYEADTHETKGSSGKILYVPHHAERWKHKRLRVNVDFLDIDCDPELFLKRIYTSTAVITSSLHGLILANAFGIPVAFFRPRGSLFKYNDYAESVGLRLKIHDDPREINYSDIPTSPFLIRHSLAEDLFMSERLLREKKVLV